MTSAAPARPTNADTSRPLRVLYVEDDPRDAKLFCKHLERAGFLLHVDVVIGPDDFVTALRSASYDVILADYALPNWSGIDALETLQRDAVIVTHAIPARMIRAHCLGISGAEATHHVQPNAGVLRLALGTEAYLGAES